jgi:protein SCO1
MEEEKNKINPSKVIIIMSVIIAAISLYLLLAIELPNKPRAGEGGGDELSKLIGGDFTLTDYIGNEFNSNQLKGKLSLVYFGFTYCPDICPTSMQKISSIIDTLDKYQIEVIPVFITIDPARDTQQILREYLGHFNKKIIGLTGSDDQIKFVADKFKVYYAKANDGNNTDYMMDHSSFLYLMDKDFKYKKHFYLKSTPEEIIEYIRINNTNL